MHFLCTLYLNSENVSVHSTLLKGMQQYVENAYGARNSKCKLCACAYTIRCKHLITNVAIIVNVVTYAAPICTIACSFLGPMPLIMFQHVLVFCCFFSHFIHNIFVSALKEFYMKVEASCKRKYHQISRGNTFESIKEMHFSEMVHIQSVSFYVITE